MQKTIDDHQIRHDCDVRKATCRGTTLASMLLKIRHDGTVLRHARNAGEVDLEPTRRDERTVLPGVERGSPPAPGVGLILELAADVGGSPCATGWLAAMAPLRSRREEHPVNPSISAACMPRTDRAAPRMVLVAILLASGWPGAAYAVPPTPREQQQITELVRRNFDACNREDIEELMQTCTAQMPDREKFRRESLACFAAKDIHYSLVECEVLDVQWPWAVIRIVQDTHVLDASTENDEQAAYWNGTALLPKDGRVEYVATCRRENGKWRLHLIVSPMRPVDR